MQAVFLQPDHMHTAGYLAAHERVNDGDADSPDDAELWVPANLSGPPTRGWPERPRARGQWGRLAESGSLGWAAGLRAIGLNQPKVSLRFIAFVSFRFVSCVAVTEPVAFRGMSDKPMQAVEAPRDSCSYPGCTRPRLPDPSTGRPTRYCGQADADGGPIHNRASAWKARRSQSGTVIHDEPGATAPVSMARATLDQRLAELPERFADLRQYLDGVVSDLRAAGDIEAAGAEVEDAHRDALTKVTDAERRVAVAERAARAANDRANAAERDREEADLIAEDARNELAQVRETAADQIEAVRAEAAEAARLAQEQLTEAEARFRSGLAERDRDLELSRQEANAARADAAAAAAAQHAAEESAARERETTAQLRRQLDQTRQDFEGVRQRLQNEIEAAHAATQQALAEAAAVRVQLATAEAEAQSASRAAELDRAAAATLTRELEREREESRSEREALRATQAEQLAQAQRNADERVHALTEALAVATAAADTYRGQLAEQSAARTKRSNS